jgi:hypothetical protein
MCKGDDLDDGVLMPKLSKKSDVVLNSRLELGSEKENFQLGRSDQIFKKGGKLFS